MRVQLRGETMTVSDGVLQAMLEKEVSPLAREAAAGLVESWIDESVQFPEVVQNWRVAGIEQAFYVKLAPKSYAIGVMDALFDDGGIVQAEWKTRRAPKITTSGKDAGRPYKGDDEDGWLDEISNGAQLA